MTDHTQKLLETVYSHGLTAGLFEVRIPLPPEASPFAVGEVPDIRYFEVNAIGCDEAIEATAKKLTLPGTEAERYFYQNARAKALQSNGVLEYYISHTLWT